MLSMFILPENLSLSYYSVSLFNCCLGIWSKFHEEALVATPNVELGQGQPRAAILGYL